VVEQATFSLIGVVVVLHRVTMNKATPSIERHTYRNDAFKKLIDDACLFFSDTPIHTLPPTFSFSGTGVYGIYYKGTYEHYSPLTNMNSNEFIHPIYIGKAVPKGWRQSRNSADSETKTNELIARLRQHARSIEVVSNLSLSHFYCRFMILDSDSSDMIGTLEASLIKKHKPLWNSSLDGFGNHDPGSGRYEQAKSDWDVLHNGRLWADKCKGKHNSIEAILSNIDRHFSK
jgi:hypothetical protein